MHEVQPGPEDRTAAEGGGTVRPRAAAAGLVFVLSACSGGQAPPETSAAPAPGMPVAGAMCKEHGVLEAICTKCNPKLIPVFQAKGDWCEEHGFPESVCPICHPERGGKPAADVSSDGAPADGTKIRFKTKDTARLAGLQIAKAELRPGRSGLVVPARIVYDATKVAVVNARSPGVIRAIKADIGIVVKRGAPLAVVQSAEVGGNVAQLDSARARLQIAEANLRREQELYEKKISAYKDVLAAQDEHAKAKAEVGALQATAGMVGAGGPSGAYTLVAPLAGVVTERNATVGNHVGTEQPLFQIVDTSAMWAELDVPEKELPRVANEQKVAITLDGLGEVELAGAIAYVAPEIDPQTRTAKVRVPLANPTGALRANLYGRARIAVAGAYETVTVPREAVQRAKGAALVFVRLAEDEFETRRVEEGPSEGALVEITKGVRAGEAVVTKGSFLLKTETLKESIGAGCCDAD